MAMQSFLLSREADGRAERTVETYQEVLEYFAECYMSDKTLDTLTRDQVRAYIVRLRRSGWARATVHKHIRHLRAFFHWCWLEDITKDNLAWALKSPKWIQRFEEPLTGEEVTALLNACSGDADTVRDQALILAFLDTGVRLGEMVSLRRDGLRFEPNGTSWIYVNHNGKTSKPRVVVMGKLCTRALQVYLNERDDDLPWLWVGRRGKFQSRGISSMIRRRAATIEMEDRIHPHLFRKTFANLFLDNLGDPERLRVLAGWSTYDMLEIYINTSHTGVVKAHRRAGPVDNLLLEGANVC